MTIDSSLLTQVQALQTRITAAAASGTPEDVLYLAKAVDALNGLISANDLLTYKNTLGGQLDTQQANAITAINAARDTAISMVVADLPNVAITATGTSATNTREICNASTAISRTLPTGAAVGTMVGYKDGTQGFFAKNLTIIPATGEKIEDQAANETLVVNRNYLSFVLKKTASDTWRII